MDCCILKTEFSYLLCSTIKLLYLIQNRKQCSVIQLLIDYRGNRTNKTLKICSHCILASVLSILFVLKCSSKGLNVKLNRITIKWKMCKEVIVWSQNHAARPNVSAVGSANKIYIVCIWFFSVWAKQDQGEFVLGSYVVRSYQAMRLQGKINPRDISQWKSIMLTIINTEKPSHVCGVFLLFKLIHNVA